MKYDEWSKQLILHKSVATSYTYNICGNRKQSEFYFCLLFHLNASIKMIRCCTLKPLDIQDYNASWAIFLLSFGRYDYRNHRLVNSKSAQNSHCWTKPDYSVPSHINISFRVTVIRKSSYSKLFPVLVIAGEGYNPILEISNKVSEAKVAMHFKPSGLLIVSSGSGLFNDLGLRCFQKLLASKGGGSHGPAQPPNRK